MNHATPVDGFGRTTHVTSAEGFGRTVQALAAATRAAVTPGARRDLYTVLNGLALRSEAAVEPLRAGVGVVSGSGGNIAVLSGSEGLLMVDAGMAVSEWKIADALRELEGGQVRFLVNTHWHFDHTEGNGWVRAGGAAVIAHRNTARHLARSVRIDEWERSFGPVDASERPDVAIEGPVTLAINGETARVAPYAPAHTDGDLSVLFERADVLHTGDTWANGFYPFIDTATGGSIDGMIRAADANLALAGEATLVIPGHGPVGRRADLVAYRDMLVDIRDRVAQLKALGRSVDETVAARPTAPYDARQRSSLITPALFTRLVYRGV